MNPTWNAAIDSACTNRGICSDRTRPKQEFFDSPLSLLTAGLVCNVPDQQAGWRWLDIDVDVIQTATWSNVDSTVTQNVTWTNLDSTVIQGASWSIIG